MNFSFFILATYLLILPLVPCGDKDECIEVNSTEQLSSPAHQDHEDENESCTPFCYCACCSVTTMDFRTSMESGLAPKLSTIEFNHPSTLQTKRPYGVWQPPKLG